MKRFYVRHGNDAYSIEAKSIEAAREAILKADGYKIIERQDTSGDFIPMSQRDSRWGHINIGSTPYKLYRYGCTITCLSMLSYWYGDWQRPDWIAKNLKYTNTGKVYWASMNDKLPMRFVYRYYRRDDNKIREILYSEDRACLLEVQDKSHWVVVIGYSKSKGFRIADPIDAEIVWLNRRYKNITGFAEVTRNK